MDVSGSAAVYPWSDGGINRAWIGWGPMARLDLLDIGFHHGLWQHTTLDFLVKVTLQ